MPGAKTYSRLIRACGIVPTLLLSLFLVARPGAALIGDCNSDGDVGVGELVVGVNLLLGDAALAACPGFDANQDGRVTVEEVVGAIADALGSPSPSVLIRALAPQAVAPSPSHLLVFGIEDIDSFPRTKAVWRTDGTLAGTSLLLRYPGFNSLSQPVAISVGSRTYFVVDRALSGPDGYELWRTDGGPASTTFVAGFGSYPERLTSLGNRLYFNARDENFEDAYWRTDGTPANTRRVTDFPAGAIARGFGHFVPVGNKLYFVATSDIAGEELWVSDGTDNNTRIIKNIRAGAAGSAPEILAAIGSTLYFSADDGTNGRELWRTDGTEANTRMVKNIRPMGASSAPRFLAVAGSTLYFSADDGVNGRELWRTDGSDVGTKMVKDINQGVAGSDGGFSFVSATVIGNVVFFPADNGMSGRELWMSDGSEANTKLVKEISAGASGSDPEELTVAGSTLFFSAADSSGQRSLWRSDGSDMGTFALTEAMPGAADFNLQMSGDTLFFSVIDAAGDPSLWKTDGTQGGTTKLRDSLVAGNVLSASGRFLFGGQDLSGFGDFLWTTDGTAAGTFPVFDPNNECGRPTSLGTAGSLFRIGHNFVLVTDLFAASGLVASVPVGQVDSAVPLRCFTASAASNRVRPDIAVFRSETGKIYYYLGVISDQRLDLRPVRSLAITSLAMSAQPIINLIERLRPPDTTLTAVSGTPAGLVDPSLIEVHRLSAVCRGRTCQPKFDPTDDGRITVDSYPDLDSTLEVKTIQWNDAEAIRLSDGSIDASVPAARTIQVSRMVDRALFDLQAIAFPSGPGAVTTSLGAFCPSTGLLCDPSDPAPPSCWGGPCAPGGTSGATQTVTLDARLGEPGPLDGIVLRASRILDLPEFVVMHGFVFVTDAAEEVDSPTQFGVAGFSVDFPGSEFGSVAGAVGP